MDERIRAQLFCGRRRAAGDPLTAPARWRCRGTAAAPCRGRWRAASGRRRRPAAVSVRRRACPGRWSRSVDGGQVQHQAAVPIRGFKQPLAQPGGTGAARVLGNGQQQPPTDQAVLSHPTAPDARLERLSVGSCCRPWRAPGSRAPHRCWPSAMASRPGGFVSTAPSDAGLPGWRQPVGHLRHCWAWDCRTAPGRIAGLVCGVGARAGRLGGPASTAAAVREGRGSPVGVGAAVFGSVHVDVGVSYRGGEAALRVAGRCADRSRDAGGGQQVA